MHKLTTWYLCTKLVLTNPEAPETRIVIYSNYLIFGYPDSRELFHIPSYSSPTFYLLNIHRMHHQYYRNPELLYLQNVTKRKAYVSLFLHTWFEAGLKRKNPMTIIMPIQHLIYILRKLNCSS